MSEEYKSTNIPMTSDYEELEAEKEKEDFIRLMNLSLIKDGNSESTNIPMTSDYEEIVADQEKDKEANFLDKEKWCDIDNSKYILDVSEKFEKPEYTLNYDGVEFAPRGGIHALTGQAGNGKTFTFTQMIVAILKGIYGRLKYNLSDVIPNPTVLYIDTEMEKGNTQLVNMRVYAMMNWTFGVPHKEFTILRLRDVTEAKERWNRTLKAIDELKPTVCFIDGLLDLIGDFNDNKECQEIIYKCMATASYYNISIWCLVHQNPNTTKMVGHVGSMLERKITDGFSTIKTKDKTTGEVTFEVKSFKTRGKDVKDTWVFKVSDDVYKLGIPYQLNSEEIEHAKENKKDIQISKIGVAITKVFKDNSNTPLNTTELQTKLCEETGISVRCIQGVWQELIANRGDSLKIDTKGKSKLYSLADPDDYRDNITKREVTM